MVEFIADPSTIKLVLDIAPTGSVIKLLPGTYFSDKITTNYTFTFVGISKDERFQNQQ